MAVPFLVTKLYIPPLRRPGMVSRPRLIKRMNESLHRKLSLVSAPAGFGKTTLVSEWIASCGQPVAWLSLDEGDNDSARFIMYLIKALQTLAVSQEHPHTVSEVEGIKVEIGEGLLAALQSPQPLQIETILTALLNEISAIAEDFLLVLDDYHSIDSQSVDQALNFLIEHQPPQMHLVIATREDPPLPLARLRARSQLIELRAADLRFTSAEAAEFLNQVMGLNLSADDIASLETRTEGWIAGLQMAAISMQGITSIAGFIQSFTGSHHFVLDYLMEEVLQRQPDNVQAFLLRTSILDRMCGHLCDAILFDSSISGQETLEYLERVNLFIVPLDSERRWYRYHHLFADLLRKRLGQNLAAEEIAGLHIRASEWYENNDLLLEAFRHAASANDIERAIRLMENKEMPLHRRGTATTILDWLESLSDAVRTARPMLWWKQATLMLEIGQTIGVEEKLQAAEAILDAATAPSETSRDLIGKIALARATRALHQFEIETILTQTRRALEYLNPNDLLYRSTATLTLGYAYFLQDELIEAGRAYAEALSLAQAGGDITIITLAKFRLGQIQAYSNQLHQAAETYQQILELIGEYSPSNTAVVYMSLADINYEWNNLNVAEKYLEQSSQLARQYAHVVDRMVLSDLYTARLKLAQGDVIAAESAASQAERIARQKNVLIRLQSLSYVQAWIHLRKGDLDAVVQLARQNNLPLMQARALIAQGDPAAALVVAEPLRQQAEVKGMVRRALEVMTVQSIALHAQGDKEKAMKLLGEVLARTEPEGFIRFFVNEGEAMQSLLEKYLSNQDSSYVERILSAFPQIEKSKIVNRQSEIVDPLSDRELEVLKLLHSELSGPEIAERLIVSLNTLRTHTKNIFNKLGVNNRRSAIRRAKELDLF